jgi:hypothetical protein
MSENPNGWDTYGRIKHRRVDKDVKEMRFEVGLVHLAQVRLESNCGLQCTLQQTTELDKNRLISPPGLVRNDFVPWGTNGTLHSESLGFWTLSIVWNSKYPENSISETSGEGRETSDSMGPNRVGLCWVP